MALHPKFPTSPYAPLIPDQRWFPADEALRSTAYEKLLPPLVAKLRQEVFAWRNKAYPGASATSVALLRHWFDTDHLTENADGSLSTLRYYFAQREAVETVIWLYEVRGARDKYDLLRFDASGAVSSGMFPEDWPRYVLKMATGAGKTKVLSLLIAWSFFHKLYEADSALSRNFLVIAPNIIVLDRLRADFDGLKIFFNDPVLPHNGYEGRNWRDDFQLTLHIQDEVRTIRPTGNFFLTNIHRVYLGQALDPTLEDEDLRDYFLSPFGPKPVGSTTDSKTDLGEIIREIDELAVFNDEAHHIHDPRMAWFQSIQDIHHKMLQKDRRLALQVDVTATPATTAAPSSSRRFPTTPWSRPSTRTSSNTLSCLMPPAAPSSPTGKAPSSPRNTTTTSGSASRSGRKATRSTKPSERKPSCSSWWTTPATAMRSASTSRRFAPSCNGRCSSSTPRTTGKSPKPLPARARKSSKSSAKKPTQLTP